MTETQSRDDAAYATVRHAIGRPGMLLVTVMVGSDYRWMRR